MKPEPCELSAEPMPQYDNYVSLTGSLMYATIGTYPDIAYTVNKLCSFNHSLDMVHWTTTKCILHYLLGMKELGITYTKGSTHGKFYRYAEISFANNHDLTLMSKNIFILNGSTITWISKKEITPMLSTAEAEFNLMAHCKVAPKSWGIGGSKVVSSKGLEGYEMFNPRDSRREDNEEENA